MKRVALILAINAVALSGTYWTDWLIAASPAVKAFALSAHLWIAMAVIVIAGTGLGLGSFAYATALDRKGAPRGRNDNFPTQHRSDPMPSCDPPATQLAGAGLGNGAR